MNKLLALLILSSYGPVCVAIILAATCRVNLMRPRAHKFSWTALYILYAAFAGCVLIYLSDNPPCPDALELPLLLMLGLAAIGLNLWLTYRHWLVKPPAITLEPT